MKLNLKGKSAMLTLFPKTRFAYAAPMLERLIRNRTHLEEMVYLRICMYVYMYSRTFLWIWLCTYICSYTCIHLHRYTKTAPSISRSNNTQTLKRPGNWKSLRSTLIILTSGAGSTVSTNSVCRHLLYSGTKLCVVSCHCSWSVSGLKCVYGVGIIARGSLGRWDSHGAEEHRGTRGYEIWF